MRSKSVLEIRAETTHLSSKMRELECLRVLALSIFYLKEDISYINKEMFDQYLKKFIENREINLL